MRNALTAIVLIFGLIGIPEAKAQDSVNNGLTRCAGIADDAARLACFDALATASVDDQTDLVDQEDQAGIAPAAPAAAATAVIAADKGPAPLSDEVGKEHIEIKSEVEEPKFTAHVTSCRKSAQSGLYYFTFENGQVWKQSNYRSLNYRDCKFDVELKKGTFGYDMYIPSKDRSVRIARVK